LTRTTHSRETITCPRTSATPADINRNGRPT
jgi:hypothetical protein